MSVLERDAVALSDGLAGCEVMLQGAAVTGFWWLERGKRIDWLHRTSVAVAGGPPRSMACHPLVPWSNRIRDGRFQFCGRDVTADDGVDALPHAPDGHGWRRRWRLVGRGETHLVLEYDHAADLWPWAYRARQTVALEEGALRLTVAVENLADSPMPAGLGFHGAFPRTKDATLAARTRGAWRTDRTGLPENWLPTPIDGEFAQGRALAGLAVDHVLTGWDGTAAIVWPERRARLEIAASWPMLSFLAVTIDPNQDHFRLAPTSQCADAVNLARAGVAETGLRVLAPGAVRTATLQFRPDLTP